MKENLAGSNDSHFQRNIGVYASFTSGSAGRRIASLDATRTYSVTTISNTTEKFLANNQKDLKHNNTTLRSSKSFDDLHTHIKPVSFIAEEKSSMKVIMNTSMSLLKNATKSKGDSLKIDGTNFFYSPLKMLHSEDMQRTGNITENKYIPTQRRSLPEKARLSSKQT